MNDFSYEVDHESLQGLCNENEDECKGCIAELQLEISSALKIVNDICDIANSHPEYEELQKYFLHLGESE